MRLAILALFSFFLTSCASNDPSNLSGYSIVMNNNAKEKVNNIIENDVIPNKFKSRGELIDQVSYQFLGTPYLANTLIGSPSEQEILVINFDGVDCFTYIDYVMALTKAIDQPSFLKELVNIRYTDDDVTYYKRKHFFSDWYGVLPQNAFDVTTMLSPDTVTVQKKLNQKADGSEYIIGLGVTARDITYIPSSKIDQKVLDKIQTGDFIGVYSPIAGLDVSHTGIAINKDNQVWYRNASSLSKNNKVVDTLLIDYIETKPGIIVLRAK